MGYLLTNSKKAFLLSNAKSIIATNFVVRSSNDMQEPYSSDNVREISHDGRQKPPKIQDPCCGENIQVLLEVEVIESLHPEMSKDKKYPTKHSAGVVEVMIIRPGTTDTVINSPQISDTAGTIEDMTKKSGELQCRQKPNRISATSATDRRHISHYDKRLNKSFVGGNVAEGPAIMMGEIVGDLPSKVDDAILHSSMNHLLHGDHCVEKAVAAKLLKSYVNFCNSGTEIGKAPPLLCANGVNPQETASRNYPLVEFSAAQKILDTYAADKSRCRDENEHHIIDAMRISLAEWGSDEKRITNTLYNDDSALTRCEQCGVISFKKSVINCQNTMDKNKKCRSTENTESIHDASSLRGHDKILQDEPPGSKSFISSQNGIKAQKTRIKEDLESKKNNSKNKERKVSACNKTEPKADDATTFQAPFLQYSSAKNKFCRSVGKPSHIPKKLDKTISAEPSSSKNFANYSERKEGEQSPLSRSSVNKSQLVDIRLWMNEAAPNKNIHEDVNLANLPRSHPHLCTVSSYDRSSTDQECKGNIQPSVSVDDQRSCHGTKNHKPRRCNPDLYHSAPLISSTKEASANEDLAIDRYVTDNGTPTRCNADSETTGFSSSSSENAIREWDNLLAEDPRVDRNPLTVKSKGEATEGRMTSLRTRIDTAIGKSTNYIDGDKTSKLDYIAKMVDRLKIPSGFSKEIPDNVKPVQDIGEKVSGERSQMTPSKKNFDNLGESYVANRAPVTHAFDKSLKLTYKNVASTISSSSGYCNVDYHGPDVRQDSLRDGKDESIPDLNESEIFERQIKYDEISSKDVSTESNGNLEAEIHPLYRKILESKDEMDWKTFQQLVETLHPSQRELWCDICKAVSNEAKRIAGETGTSTEVCIEINPVPNRQVFPSEQKTKVKTSDGEISFGMDMVLTDSESFFDLKPHAS